MDEAQGKGKKAPGAEEHERGDEEKEDKGTNDGGVVDDKVSTDEKEKLRHEDSGVPDDAVQGALQSEAGEEQQEAQGDEHEPAQHIGNEQQRDNHDEGFILFFV